MDQGVGFREVLQVHHSFGRPLVGFWIPFLFSFGSHFPPLEIGEDLGTAAHKDVGFLFFLSWEIMVDELMSYGMMGRGGANASMGGEAGKAVDLGHPFFLLLLQYELDDERQFRILRTTRSEEWNNNLQQQEQRAGR